MCTQLYPCSDSTLTKRKSKCHRGRLRLLRRVVSSIATGDKRASEEQITEVHQIAPSRPTGCLRHGNVQCAPSWPVMPERSRPSRRTFQQQGKNTKESSLTLWRMHRYLLPPLTAGRHPALGLLNEDSLCPVWPHGLHPKRRTEEGISRGGLD